MIEVTEINGIATLYSPSQGATHAGLAFRVGQADETLARSGITHLVEHLALHHFGMADYHYNGSTGSVMTAFHLQGSLDDVTGFLTGVCDSLSALPYDRLELEREILRTEASSRTRSVLEPMGVWRYGAKGYGVGSYPEWGLSELTPDDLRAWVARYFTKENAVLWVGGPTLPTGLRLNLPSGARQPVPAPSSALPAMPAYFSGSARVVGFEGIMRRSTAGSIFAGVLERELFRALRQEGGWSYTATASYDPRGDEYASIVALADSLPEKHDAVLGGFVDVLAKLRVGRIEQSDVDAVLAKADDALTQPDVDALRLPTLAFNHLTGHPNHTAAEHLAQMRAVTLADLRAVAVEVCATGLLMVPERRDAEWAGFAPAPTASTTRVDGTPYPSRESQDHQLVVGPSGVSAVTPHGLATVLYGACAAMLVWPDGGRMLLGEDGIACRVEPTIYQVDPAVLQYIDSHVQPARVVHLAARSPEAIPQPRQPAPVPAPVPAAAPASAPSRPGGLELVALIAIALVTLVCLCWSGITTLAGIDNPDADGGYWGVVAVSWVVAVILVVPAIVLLRRRRRS